VNVASFRISLHTQMREYLSRAPPLYRISPNLKRTVT